MRLILTLALCLAASVPAVADTIAVGTQDVNGYVFQADGYWHRGDGLFTRSAIWTAGYYSGSGCCRTYYPGYWTFSYNPAKAVSYKDPDWRDGLLRIAERRDKVEGEIRKEAFNQKYFMEAVESLGLRGNFRIDGYGQQAPYGSYGGSYQLGSYGANGATIYGSTYSSVASVYGDANLPSLYQSAARLTENAQKLAGQAGTDFSELVGQEGSNRARVAEILAKAEVIRSLDSKSATVTTKGGTFSVTQNSALPGAALRMAKCAACHSGANLKGGFDIASYPSLMIEKKATVWQRILTDDLERRMPRLPDGGPGPKLTQEEFKIFVGD